LERTVEGFPVSFRKDHARSETDILDMFLGQPHL
jgi:hypothetical protein